MPETPTMSVRIDPDLKAAAESIFSELGFTLSGAITVFLRQCVYERQIPFIITRKGGNSSDTIDLYSIFTDAGVEDPIP